jgi:hypothetical protein
MKDAQQEDSQKKQLLKQEENLPNVRDQKESKGTVSIEKEILERFLSLEEKKINLKAQNLSIKEIEVKQSHEFAKDALCAQKEDYKDQRSHESSKLIIIFAYY